VTGDPKILPEVSGENSLTYCRAKHKVKSAASQGRGGRVSRDSWGHSSTDLRRRVGSFGLRSHGPCFPNSGPSSSSGSRGGGFVEGMQNKISGLEFRVLGLEYIEGVIREVSHLELVGGDEVLDGLLLHLALVNSLALIKLLEENNLAVLVLGVLVNSLVVGGSEGHVLNVGSDRLEELVIISVPGQRGLKLEFGSAHVMLKS